jgi:chromate transporter
VAFARVEPVAFGPFSVGLPDPASLLPDAVALSLLAAVCLFGLKLGLVRTLAVTAAAGLALRLLLGA